MNRRPAMLVVALLFGSLLCGALADPPPPGPADWTVTGARPDSNCGFSVALANINGDGYVDAIIGEPNWDNGSIQAHEGRIAIHLGGDGGLSPIPLSYREANASGGRFGFSVARAGDIDGDGCDDVLVGAPYYLAGRVLLYLGNRNTGLETLASWFEDGIHIGAQFGYSIAGVGNLDGDVDGCDDIIIGSPGLIYGGMQNAGRASLYRGRSDGTMVYWSNVSGNQAGARLGAAVASAGDVNGDGMRDFLVAAPAFSDGEIGEGRVLLYLGGTAGITLGGYRDGNQIGAQFGAALAGGGDVNGDGYDDVLIGAPGYSNTVSKEGQAFLYAGGPDGWSAAPIWTYSSGIALSRCGAALSCAGDVDGDGCSDIIVGVANVAHGFVHLFRGSPAGPPAAPSWTLEGSQYAELLGTALAYGDVNGDGGDDIVVGAPGYETAMGTLGAAFAYYPPTPPTFIAQFAPDGSIIAAGATITAGGFTARGDVGGSAAIPVRLHAEVRPVGVPFDGTPMFVGDPVSGEGAASVSCIGLAEGAGFRWRIRAVSHGGLPSRWADPGGDPDDPDVADFVTATNVEPRDPAWRMVDVAGGRTVGPGGRMVEGLLRIEALVQDPNPGRVALDVRHRAAGEDIAVSQVSSTGFVANDSLAGVEMTLGPGPWCFEARTRDEFGRTSAWVDLRGALAFDLLALPEGSVASTWHLCSASAAAGGLAALGATALVLAGASRRRR